ncbi:MAG: hypothetical protein ACW99J_17825 [Candidatus Thorarchaeota archaeon]|jgi:hypothetical protein
METVGELIESLKEFDPNLRLLVETPNMRADHYEVSGIRQVSADFVIVDIE